MGKRRVVVIEPFEFEDRTKENLTQIPASPIAEPSETVTESSDPLAEIEAETDTTSEPVAETSEPVAETSEPLATPSEKRVAEDAPQAPKKRVMTEARRKALARANEVRKANYEKKLTEKSLAEEEKMARLEKTIQERVLETLRTEEAEYDADPAEEPPRNWQPPVRVHDRRLSEMYEKIFGRR